MSAVNSVQMDFFRYPHTPHALGLGAALARDDKSLSPTELRRLLNGSVTVEEKIDGANVGFSLQPDTEIRAQNRGQYLTIPYSGQFARLNAWLAQHQMTFVERLRPGLIVFAEWCAARHSVDYCALPDWLIIIDVFDREHRKFWSVARRNAWAHAAALDVPPLVMARSTDADELTDIVWRLHSQYGDSFAEGVVIRRDEGDWLAQKAKLVHPNFTQSIAEHWRGRNLTWNRVAEVRR